MKCVILKHSGFCFGVALAVKEAYENVGADACMYGEVVHNPVVVADLQSKGLGIARGLDDIPEDPGVKVLIRAHGISKNEIKAISARGAIIIDKTCSKVKAIHNIVDSASKRGLDLVIVGREDHPEILGIKGWCQTQILVLGDLEEAKKIMPDAKFARQGLCMVAQTTYNEKKYLEIYEYCASATQNIEFHNTVCDETARRQDEVSAMAKIADCVIIVGGRGSSNVAKLHEIAKEHCAKTQQVESERGIDFSQLVDVEALVVASGASTPAESVEETAAAIKAWCVGMGGVFELERL